MKKNFQQLVTNGGCDLHVHTNKSDGKFSLHEVLELALREGHSAIAITDHNGFNPQIEELAPRYEKQGLRVINGAEFTASYYLPDGRKEEVHIIGLNFKSAKLQALFQRYSNRRPYVEAILDKLRAANVVDIKYNDLEAAFDSVYLGRMHIAQMLVSKGIAKDVYAALDDYGIGHLSPTRHCWVEPSQYLDIPDVESVIEAIIAAEGIPVLCHPYYYREFTEGDREKLIATFKCLAGEKATMEIYYKNYDEEQIQTLEKYRKKYGLRASCGSDFHGWHLGEHLKQFDTNILEELLK